MRTLASEMQISPRYRRSIHVESDLGSLGALDGYVLSPLACDAATRIVGGLTHGRGNRAWNLVGPYGSGKSSFLVLLGSLLSRADDYDAARELIAGSDIPSARLLLNSLDEAKPLLPVVVTGQHGTIAGAILRAITKTAGEFWAGPGTKPAVLQTVHDLAAKAENERVADADVVDAVLEIANAVRRSSKAGTGICLLIDEMGKMVEWAALQKSVADLYLLQLLAEAAARTDGASLCVVTTLHQRLDAYADGLPRSVRNEWAKVEGRFEVIPYLESPRHVTRLVAGALMPSEAAAGTPVFRRVRRDVETLAGTGDDQFPATQLRSCAPLSPVVALCLGPLFRLRLGQNERSLFAFLASQEPHGFQSFIATADLQGATPYTLDGLFDYVIANTGVRVSGGGRDRTWAAAEQALTRLPTDATEVDASVIKATAILGLVGLAAKLKADVSTLAIALGRSTGAVEQSLARLEAASIVVYRKFRAAYQIWDGSDLDVSALIAEHRSLVAAEGGFAARLQRQFPPFPIIAARHYHTTGTLRHLVPRFVPVPSTANSWPQTSEGDGDILFVVPDRLEDLEHATALLTGQLQWADATPRPLVVALPRDAAQLHERLLDLFAIEGALAGTAALDGDPVARRELNERRLRAQDLLADAIAMSFTADGGSLRWYHRGKLVQASGRASALASAIFDEAYSAAPPIFNELINRESISSSAAGARRVLLEALFTDLEKPRLGFEGYPAEFSLYRSVFEATKLHGEADGAWRLIPPSPSSTLWPAWSAIAEVLRGLRGQRATFDDIYAALAKPPLGVRQGLAPILVLTYYLTNANTLCLYEDNSLLPEPGPDLVPRLLKKPDTFELQQPRADARMTAVINALATRLNVTKQDPTLLDIVKPILGIVLRLSKYASTTQTVSPTTRRVRSAIKAARDPLKLLLLDLPKACEVGFVPDRAPSTKEVATFTHRLVTALGALQEADSKLLESIDGRVRRHFGGDGEDAVSFYGQFARRAEQLQDVEHVPTAARNFVSIAATGNASSPEMLTILLKGMGTAVVGKMPEHWTDNDVRHFEYRVVDVARAFRAAEALQVETGDPSAGRPGPRLLRVSVLDSEGRERHGIAASKLAASRLVSFQAAINSLADEHGIAGDDLAYGVIAAMVDRLRVETTQEIR